MTVAYSTSVVVVATVGPAMVVVTVPVTAMVEVVNVV